MKAISGETVCSIDEEREDEPGMRRREGEREGWGKKEGKEGRRERER